MYTEENEKKQFPLRDYLLKIAIVIIIVFLIVWLLLKLISPATGNIKSNSPLDAKVFGENINKMKEAALTYYTKDHLPKEVGEKKTLTLREMISEKLLIAFVDKDGKACKVDKSYASLTKEKDEYLLKVNLECSSEKDYLLTYVGPYNYCDTELCEKKEISVNKKQTEPAKTVTINENKDKKPSEEKSELAITEDSSSEEESSLKPTEEEIKAMVFEYSKTEGREMSAWSSFSPWQINVENLQATNCDDSDLNCVKKVKTTSRQEDRGTYQQPYKQKRKVLKLVGSYRESACANYNYVRLDETTYQTGSSVDYTSFESITEQTRSNTGSWIYQGIEKRAIADNATTKYKLTNSNLGSCKDNCQAPVLEYAKYTLNGTMKDVTANNSPTTSTLANSTAVKKANTSIKTSCSKKITKTIPVYRFITTYELASRTEPIYATVHYYSVSTRTVLKEGKTSTKWSYYNDTSLLKKGYSYTGNKKNK